MEQDKIWYARGGCGSLCRSNKNLLDLVYHKSIFINLLVYLILAGICNIRDEIDHLLYSNVID